MTGNYKEHKLEVLKMLYEKQTQLLGSLTEIDLKLIISMMTLQLALGAWLASLSTMDLLLKVGLLLVDVAVVGGVVCVLYLNRNRRQQVAKVVINLNKALGVYEDGAYLEGEALSVKDEPKLWFWPYAFVSAVSVAGVGLMLCFGVSTTPADGLPEHDAEEAVSCLVSTARSMSR